MRDRATFLVALLKGLEAGGVGVGHLDARSLLLEPLAVPLDAIEASCKDYLANPSETPFTLSSVTVAPELLQKERKAAAAAVTMMAESSAVSRAVPDRQIEVHGRAILHACYVLVYVQCCAHGCHMSSG